MEKPFAGPTADTHIRNIVSADVEPLANREQLHAAAPRFPLQRSADAIVAGRGSGPSTLRADSPDQLLPIAAKATPRGEAILATTLPVYFPLTALDDPINGGFSRNSRHGRADSNVPALGRASPAASPPEAFICSCIIRKAISS